MYRLAKLYAPQLLTFFPSPIRILGILDLGDWLLCYEEHLPRY